MGFYSALHKFQEKVSSFKTTGIDYEPDTSDGLNDGTSTPNSHPSGKNSPGPIGSGAEYDPNYDPADKKNAGGFSVGTVGTYFEDSPDSKELGEVDRTPHTFQDPKVAQYYRDLYEKAGYECRHRFDPDFYWTKKEERKLVRRCDIRVVFAAFMMFVALDIDRYNMKNATSGTLFKDLNITTNDYNTGNTINLVCFLAAEIPSQLISKAIGPDVWIPIQMVSWSLVATLQCVMTNKSGFYATRALIGLMEGGFIPDVCLWMSYFFKAEEMSTRVGYFYIANPLVGSISALLAYGIFHLDGRHGWAGWRYLFLIEGLITLAMGVAAFFFMPPSIVQTRAKWRPNGWFTPHEEKIMVNRVLRDDPTKGDMNNRTALTPKLIFKSVMDYTMWPVYLSRLFLDILGSPVNTYMPIILRGEGMNFSTLDTNLLMIPYGIGTIITMLSQVHLSKYFKQKAYFLAFTSVWLIPGLACMRWWPGFLRDKWGSYALLTVYLSFPPSWALSISWLSQNSGSVRTRTISASMVNVFSQIANIIANNMFRKDDSPRYARGLQQLFALAITSLVVILGSRLFYVLLNRKRKAKWDAMTPEEQSEYLATTTDEGNQRLNFRYCY